MLWAMLLMLALSATAQRTNQAYWTYIDRYKSMAIDQMRRYKIPASITLAQGLLESNAGRSTLATQANNHFGIKVGGTWTGPYVIKSDDRPDDRFRKYKSPAESYEDHSRFLAGGKRYQGLFQLRLTDYKGWARGLKAAGYATNPAYAESLITVIEAYNLSQFDSGHASHSTVGKSAAQQEKLSLFWQTHDLLVNNKCYFIIVEAGDNMATISKETGLSLRKLYKYNDLPRTYAPTAGDVIYLEKKQRHASREFRKRPIHIVEENQSIHDIAQLYGIRLKKFYKMNKWEKDHDIKPGDILRIR